MNHIKHLPYQTRKKNLCKTKDKKKKKIKKNKIKKKQLDSTICNVKNAWNLPIFGVFLNLFQAPKSLFQ